MRSQVLRQMVTGIGRGRGMDWKWREQETQLLEGVVLAEHREGIKEFDLSTYLDLSLFYLSLVYPIETCLGICHLGIVFHRPYNMTWRNYIITSLQKPNFFFIPISNSELQITLFYSLK